MAAALPRGPRAHVPSGGDAARRPRRQQRSQSEHSDAPGVDPGATRLNGVALTEPTARRQPLGQYWRTALSRCIRLTGFFIVNTPLGARRGSDVEMITGTAL